MLQRTSTFLSVAILIAFLSVPVVAQQAKQESKDAKAKAEQKKDDKKKDAKDKKGKQASDVPAALDFTMKDINGEDVELAKYEGNVVLFVNVASKCGFTKQYTQLQELHEEYADKGLSIVGIPCNQFGGQEPGSEAEIAKFCNDKYGVEFDLMSKVDVKDKKMCELYEHLTDLDLKPTGKSDVKWNFEKFVLNRKGEPIARFGSRTRPDSDEMMEVIEAALAESAGHYKHKSSKLGTEYYLFSKDVPLKNSNGVSTIYFFSKDPNNKKGKPLAKVPADRIVSETKTGMLVLKKKPGAKAGSKKTGSKK